MEEAFPELCKLISCLGPDGWPLGDYRDASQARAAGHLIKSRGGVPTFVKVNGPLGEQLAYTSCQEPVVTSPAGAGRPADPSSELKLILQLREFQGS